MHYTTTNDALTRYTEAGWPVVMPLRPNGKKPLAAGIHGRDVPLAERQNNAEAAWRNAPETANLAVLMIAPAEANYNLIGLDIDHYGNKRGADDLKTLEKELGSLNLHEVPRSTRRGKNSEAATYFFKVPTGLEFGWPDTTPDIDLIQAGHRYSAVWPSEVDGMAYRWYQGAEELAEVPRPEALPELPTAWVSYLSRPARSRSPKADVQGYENACQWLKDRVFPGKAEPLNIDWQHGSRHDSMNQKVMKLVNEAVHFGKSGLMSTLDALRDEFTAALADTGEQHRAGEFEKSVIDAVRKVKGEIDSGQRNTIDWLELERHLSLHSNPEALECSAASELLVPSSIPEAADNAPGRLHGIMDLSAILSGDWEPIKAELGHMTNGTALLYPGEVHDVHGYSGSGKSWVGFAFAAQELKAGNNVLWLDYEQNAEQAVRRLQALGVPDQVILDRFGYMRPEEFPFPGTEAEAEFATDLSSRDFSLAIIDGVNQSFSLAGFEANNTDNANRWHRLIPERIARTGAAVVQIDHTVKNRDGDMTHAFGAQGKRANVAVSFGAHTTTQTLRPGHTGKLDLVVYKDRHGDLLGRATPRKNGHHIATFVLADDNDFWFESVETNPISPAKAAVCTPGLLDSPNDLPSDDVRCMASVAQTNAALAIYMCERGNKNGVSLQEVREAWKQYAPQRWEGERDAILRQTTRSTPRGLVRVGERKNRERFRGVTKEDNGARHIDYSGVEKLLELLRTHD